MANYLLEIGVEELPAGFVPEAEERLREFLRSGLTESNIAFKHIRSYSTPRRLTAVVEDIAAVQTTTEKKVKGPAVKSSFDANNKPTPQAEGFAKKHGLNASELTREEVGGVEYLHAVVVNSGKATEEVLPEIVNKVIGQISGERLMRWGECEVKFSRPLRWLVSLLDDKLVDITVANFKSGRLTRGHRILHPGEISIAHADKYEETLKQAFVIVDPAKRKDMVEVQVQARANELGGIAPQLKSGLLEEVVNLTEWPTALVGQFEEGYLTLPATLIETIMIHHQRYFPVEAKEQTDSSNRTLLPYFITITNNDRKEAAPHIKQGNERVLRARLADGKFFFFDDSKAKLEDRLPALAKLTYQEGLGSYGDKTDRLSQLATVLTNSEPASSVLSSHEKANLVRICQLMKLDLVSNLVRELPELQGYVGSWYAKREGEPSEVVQAILSHYAPRSSNDDIPQDRLGQLAAVLDKLDHVVGLFALGKKPTGSSDPYALRRNAQGLIDIVVDGLTDLPINITTLVGSLLMAFEPLVENAGHENANKNGKSEKSDKSEKNGKGNHKKFDDESIAAEVKEFIMQRLKGKLLDGGNGKELVEAVLSARDPLANVSDVMVRMRTIKNLVSAPGASDLLRVGIRIGNILKADSPDTVQVDLLTEDCEKALWEAFQKNVKANWERSGNADSFTLPTTEAEYQSLFDLLRQLTPHIDTFFKDLLVNDEDQAKRNNRHGILKNIDRYFRALADFTKLQPLTNQ
ncbi:MAG: glycine--tRNA ligase subunit beta [Candidatus Obscuribacterales bacterium]|jgi:glycyl-tRNA synthetase beta chain